MKEVYIVCYSYAQIMERLLHKNVIRLIEVEKSSIGSVLVVEFAEGGELFDRIGFLFLSHEPDVGINESLAHFYFVQLGLLIVVISVRAVEYIHSRGVCHRDIVGWFLVTKAWASDPITVP